jgi:hypothetical protein
MTSRGRDVADTENCARGQGASGGSDGLIHGEAGTALGCSHQWKSDQTTYRC